jgi:hypothetical protein
MSTLVIQIKAASATAREINTKNGKKKVAEQVGFIEMNDEVRKVRVPIDIEGGQVPYPVGKYTLGASSFQVGKYNDLEINRYEMSLVPLVATVSPAKAG